MSGRVRNIDILRGIAILGVVQLHAFSQTGAYAFLGAPDAALKFASIGWAGVDLFFVLSAYLLTGNLLRHRDAPGLALSFYKRRALRILPLYWTVLIVGSLLGIIWDISGGIANSFLFGNQHPLWVYLVFAQNWIDGWTGARAAMFLAPTWSLAVEEHLYLLLPLFVPRLGLRGLCALAVAWIVTAPFIRYGLASDVRPWAAYVWTIARLDAFGIGIIAAVWMSKRPETIRALPPRPFALAAAAFWALLSRIAPEPQTGLLASAIAPTIAAAAAACALVAGLAAAGRPSAAPAGRLARALAWCGEHCFSLYLLHLPLIAAPFLFAGAPQVAPNVMNSVEGVLLTLIGVGATFGLAGLAYRWIEKPYMDMAETAAPYRRAAAVADAPLRAV
ncbi:MAG: acyltransferase [Rhodoblastus sp.]|nr:acyltransferase [Rhodoblastus sp.]